MILYFSATGNTKYAAETLAELLDDEALDLLPRIKSHDYSQIRSEKPFVICSPVFVSEMPRFLAGYLKKTPLAGNSRVYFIFTSGGFTGISSVLARRIVMQKAAGSENHLVYMGSADLTMPGNYIASNLFPTPAQSEIEKRIRTSAESLLSAAQQISEGKHIEERHVRLLETAITLPFNPVWCSTRQGTGGFHATDQCISCGKCEKLCPVNAIRIEDKKPVWTQKTCAHCMSCIQNCPTEAIEYGKITQGKERYLFRKYSYSLPSNQKA